MAILFGEDYGYYPMATPDYTTTNKTALRLAAVYKAMGVRNHTFHLTLLDQRLKGVDPHDPDISEANAMRVIQECKNNFWYFIREVFRVSDGVSSDPFRMHRGNIAIFWLMLNHITPVVIGTRQLFGKSLCLDVMHIYVVMVAGIGVNINLLTKDRILRASNVKRLKNLRDVLPVYMRLKDRKDPDNTEEFGCTKLANSLVGFVSAGNPKSALNIGRGKTAEINTVDEGCFVNYIGISMPAMFATGGQARRRADENDTPWYSVIATTAGSVTDRDGRFIYNIKQEAAPWNEKMYDLMNLEDLRDVVRKSSKGKTDKLVVNCTFTHRMLGFSDNDLARAIADAMMSDQADIDRDFLVKWYFGSEGSAIDQNILNLMKDTIVEDPLIDIDSGYTVEWLVPASKIQAYRHKPIVVSMDPSDAKGGDGLGVIVQDPSTGETIAIANVNSTNLTTFTKWFYNYFVVGFEKSLILIERRSSGPGIIDQLLLLMLADNINPFTRMFNWVVNDTYDKDTLEKYTKCNSRTELAKLCNTKAKSFGFATSGSGKTARSNIYGHVFNTSVDMLPHLVNSIHLLDQLSNLVEKDNKVDHAEGAHDDLVIAWLLSNWLLLQGYNLSAYGIDTRSVLRYVPRKPMLGESKELSHEESRKLDFVNKSQTKLRHDLDTAIEGLRSARSVVDSVKFKRKIQSLTDKIQTGANEDLSIASIQSGIKEEKRSKRLHRKLKKR